MCSYHIETSPLILSPNQWTSFYTIGTSVMKELIFSLYSASPLVNVVEKVPITNRTAICSDDSQLVPTMSPPPTGYVDVQQSMTVRLVLYCFLHTLLLFCFCCYSKKKGLLFAWLKWDIAIFIHLKFKIEETVLKYLNECILEKSSSNKYLHILSAKIHRKISAVESNF